MPLHLIQGELEGLGKFLQIQSAIAVSVEFFKGLRGSPLRQVRTRCQIGARRGRPRRPRQAGRRGWRPLLCRS